MDLPTKESINEWIDNILSEYDDDGDRGLVQERIKEMVLNTVTSIVPTEEQSEVMGQGEFNGWKATTDYINDRLKHLV